MEETHEGSRSGTGLGAVARYGLITFDAPSRVEESPNLADTRLHRP